MRRYGPHGLEPETAFCSAVMCRYIEARDVSVRAESTDDLGDLMRKPLDLGGISGP